MTSTKKVVECNFFNMCEITKKIKEKNMGQHKKFKYYDKDLKEVE